MTVRTVTTRKPLIPAVTAVAAVTSLTLAACAPEEAAQFEEENQNAEEAETVDEGTEDEPAEGQDTEENEDPGAATDEDEAEDTADDSDTGAASGEGAVYDVAEFLAEEYPDGVIGQLEDEGAYFEVEIFDPAAEVEYEFELDPESFDIWDYEEESLDGDDRAKAESVEIEFTEAVQIAESEGDSEFYEADLDTENGVVVWEIELRNDVEVYVDVATGDIVKVDN
ncbi:PepSY domain-containing protein [Nesterenkonia alba]|uniref:PepSY domain-containing protein n=1 Tax=Nesterenkonia alba TaxID=515814 RepID=UPI0003B3BDD0|nr:PepSY domain-containing protein [Nesterenkonia alba]